MSRSELQHSWLQKHLAQVPENRPRHSPVWLTRIRDQANQAISELPVINRKLEAWRYTSIEGLLKHQFQPPLKPLMSSGDMCEQDIHLQFIPDLDTYRMVLVNGQYAPHLSNIQELPAGVSLDSLRLVLSTDPDSLATWFGQTAQHTEHVFTALNTALTNDGVFLHVSKQVELDRPIEVIYVGNDDEHSLLMQPRCLIVLDEGARATLIERFIGTEGALYFQNHLTEISVGKNASLNHYRVQDESRQAYHLSSIYLSQQAQSHYHGTTLAFGGAWNRTEYHTRFKQEDAECVLSGLSTAGDQQLSDFHLDVRHSAPACVSREKFKGVLYGKGRAVFDGYILVDKQAQGSDARLTNDNLLLTRQAEVDTKPQLEIYADDVKCSHGTTVGELDPQQIFYLRSRGIDEEAARRILCLGFASDIIDSIHVPALHRDVVRKLSATLNTAVTARD